MRYYIGYAGIVGVVLLVATVGLQIGKIAFHVQKGIYSHKPFVRVRPDATLKMLFVGDSTAVGTGAQDNTESVAGWFGRDFPQANIENKGVNGQRISGLLQEFQPSGQEHYDLVVIQIGANDIMKFTPVGEIDQGISTLIDRAKSIGRQVVILHSGNIGLAPVFIWPFNALLTHRSRIVRGLYMQKARQQGVLYVDLFTERDNDLFLKDIDKYYSPDHLHPSGAGYRWWYERIRWTLGQAGVKL